MDRDARAVREGRPIAFTDCFSGQGLDEVIGHLQAAGMLSGSPMVQS
jgi:Ni2+-binding GTPase involved in maturation of urease and hydrogenase